MQKKVEAELKVEHHAAQARLMAELRCRVAKGRYVVDPDAVARSILGRLLAARHAREGG